ncbi:unnamed protein product [Lathyrus oleraceus]
MSKPPIFVSDLEIGNHVWKMAIRIIDLWTIKERNGQLHVKMVIQYAKGHKIQVVTRHRDYKHWTKMLIEHETYALYNGEPLKNDLPLKAYENHLKVMFTTATTGCKNAIHNIHAHQSLIFLMEHSSMTSYMMSLEYCTRL